MVGVVVVLTLVTALATIIPALRIAWNDPATTLRDE
jgi:ABC-type lipoprotein release transport system permease subunit